MSELNIFIKIFLAVVLGYSAINAILNNHPLFATFCIGSYFIITYLYRNYINKGEQNDKTKQPI